MPERDALDLAHGVPKVAVSSMSTSVNRTGSWKYIRPVYRDRVAPCNHGCPVGIDIEGYMNLVRDGRTAEAVELLLRENPLPATTGRVCYHPCETACNRARFDEAVSIHAVERMLGDLALESPPPVTARRTRAETVGVIGSGPSGLACAYHLARMGYGVTVYEAEAEPGGVLRWGIPAYRLPKDVLAREIARIAAHGVTFRTHARIGRELTFGEVARHDGVYVATGVHRSRPLGIPGDDLAGVMPGLAFLREVNAGRAPDVGRRVVVVGGGNTAMDCARTAARLGADVLVVYRRGRAEMPANAEEVEEAVCEGVRFEFLAAPVAATSRGDAPAGPLDGIEASFGEPATAARPRVAALECVRMRLGEPDASGRRRPEPAEGSGFLVDADTVLTALGEDADLEFAGGRLTGSGALRINPLGAAGHAVFAGGDLLDEPHTVAFAIGSGKRAAIGIDHWLRLQAGEDPDQVELGSLRLGPAGNLSMTRWRGDDPVRRTNAANEVVPFEDLNLEQVAHAPRRRDRHRPAESSRLDFAEVNHGLRRDDALAEAGRCIHCGVCDGCEVCLIFCPDVAISRRDDGGFDIAYDHCKGCGVCATECPRGAITMTREGL